MNSVLLSLLCYLWVWYTILYDVWENVKSSLSNKEQLCYEIFDVALIINLETCLAVIWKSESELPTKRAGGRNITELYFGENRNNKRKSKWGFIVNKPHKIPYIIIFDLYL